MFFQSKGFWMSKDAGCLADGEITYDNASRMEPKRSHQWFIDSGETELFPNKKQTVEVSSGNSFGGILSSSLSPWGNVANFHCVPNQLSERLFDTEVDGEASRSINCDDGSITSVDARNLNLGRKVMDDLFVDNSSFGLSISHPLDDPKMGINYGGFRKVKVSEVRDSENLIPISLESGPSYTREDNNIISASHGYDKMDDSGISMGLTHAREEDSVITVGDSCGRENNNFISVGQSLSKGDVNNMTMGLTFKTDTGSIHIPSSFGNNESNVLSMTENFKGDSSVFSVGTLSKGDDITISSSQACKGGGNSISMSGSYNKGDARNTSIVQSNNGVDCNGLSMSHSIDKEGSSVISFGGYGNNDDSSERLLCSYDLLMNQPSISKPDSLSQKDLVISDANALLGTAQVLVAGADSTSKKKEDQKVIKKTPPNNFPSNVRSLLSTGILDEVSVKYIAWSREKELRGVIKGSGYLCGCQSCNFSKVINAYEFERHAGCKTKHPNNHIYFENGKTIYGIVQELRSTPQTMLFDVIQTITGSPINQKSFRLWKESFLAATRELRRIYGKDERNQPL